MPVIRNAKVIAIRDEIPGPYTNRDQQDLVGVSQATDQDAKFAISGNGRPDRDGVLAGMLRARPMKQVRVTGVRPSSGNAVAARLLIDSRGNLLDGQMGDVVDIVTSRTFLFIAAAVGVYYALNPNQVPWRKHS